jgi:hypothetical protein
MIYWGKFSYHKIKYIFIASLSQKEMNKDLFASICRYNLCLYLQLHRKSTKSDMSRVSVIHFQRGARCKLKVFLSENNIYIYMVRVMVFNTTYHNISVILWQSVLLVEETGVPGENHQPVVSHWQTLSHNVISSTPRHERDM